jgi:hypothetical protein
MGLVTLNDSPARVDQRPALPGTEDDIGDIEPETKSLTRLACEFPCPSGLPAQQADEPVDNGC